MKFQSSVLIVKDIIRAKEFYTRVLKLSIEFDFGNCIGFEGGLSIWELKDEYPITKHRGEKYSDSGNSNLEICLESDNFESDVALLKQFNLKYLHTTLEEKWGQKTIRFYDPENNLIELGETMPCFVKRFKKEGLSESQIADKTSIPLALVKKYLAD